MKYISRLFVLVASCGLAITAKIEAQPSLLSLGSGAPVSVTNKIGGSVYVGGYGPTPYVGGLEPSSSIAAVRWTVDAASITAITSPAGFRGGKLSVGDGLYQTASILNNPRFAIGNTATGVSPPFNPNPVLTPSATIPADTQFGGARWNVIANSLFNMGTIGIIPFTPNPAPSIDIGNSGIYGPGSVGGIYGPTSDFLTPNGISANGRFIVGQAFPSAYNTGINPGTSIGAESFYVRPVIWDAEGNAGAGSLYVLPTPFRTATGSGENTRRRLGSAYAVSNDGLVVAGATEFSSTVTPGPDVDGGRLVVWRYDSGAGNWGMSYLDTGVDANGFPRYFTYAPRSVAMNSAGTIIAARGPDGITKWIWNGSSWSSPIVIGASLGPATPISTITCVSPTATVTTVSNHGLAVNDIVLISGNTSTNYNKYWKVSVIVNATTFRFSSACAPSGSGGTVAKAPSWKLDGSLYSGQPPTLGATIAMSDDGNTIVGSAVYSGQSGGFIWRSADNYIKDWYDYIVSVGTTGYSTIALLGSHFLANPVLGNPTAISPDGSIVVGKLSSYNPAWIWQADGGSACIPPMVAGNPEALTNINACIDSVNLFAYASGTPPFTYRWYKNGNPLSNGPSGYGSTINGVSGDALAIYVPSGMSLPWGEAGTYTCVITGPCGSPVTTTPAILQVDPNYPAVVNDTCATAIPVNQGTNVLGAGISPCGAYVDDIAHACATADLDLWYTFTPALSMQYRIETCGSSVDTVLSVFSGCSAGAELACNDNLVVNSFDNCRSTASRITALQLTAGTPYYIKVSVRQYSVQVPDTSLFNLSINPAFPSNDECVNATPAIVSTSLTSPGNSLDTSGAILGAVTNCSASSITTRDVWFKYTAPSTPARGRIAITTCPGGGTWNSALKVFDGCGGTELACNTGIGSPAPTGCSSNHSGIRMLPTVADSTYYIRVGGINTDYYGATKLHIFVLGDTNHDGALTPDDIPGFVNGVMSATYDLFADMDGNRTVDAHDIRPFVDCLAQ